MPACFGGPMSEEELATIKPTYVSSAADAELARQAGGNKVIIWRNSFGSKPLGEQYKKEYEDPPFNPQAPFTFPDHPFWG